MNFGGQTITFVSYEPSGEPGPLGGRTMVATATDVKGCMHQPIPLSAGAGSGTIRNESPETGVTVATQYFRSTCPPKPAAVAAKGSDVIRVDGITYQIVGEVQHVYDIDGTIDHVTIVSERQTIG